MFEAKSVIPLPTEVTSGCGVSSVQMALDAYGIHIPQKQLAQELGTTYEDGTSQEKIREFFWRMGFKTIEKAFCTWDELKKIRGQYREPIIVEWWDDRDYRELGIDTPNIEPDSHYSLVSSIDDDMIVIADPSLGDEATFDRDYWMKHWRYRTDYVETFGWYMLISPNLSPLSS